MSWRKKKYVLSVAALAVVPGAAIWFATPPATTLKEILQRKGFMEIVPPTKFNGPGTINTIELQPDGKIRLHPTCEIDSKSLPEVFESATVDEKFVDVLDRRFNISGQIKSMLSSSSAQTRTEAVYVSLENVTVLAMSDQSLLKLQQQLIRDGCQAAIAWNLQNGGIVCQIEAALRADVTYTITFKSNLSASEEAKISKELAQKLKLETDRQGSNRIVGRGLFYGVRLQPNGIVLNSPDAKPTGCRIRVK